MLIEGLALALIEELALPETLGDILDDGEVLGLFDDDGESEDEALDDFDDEGLIEDELLLEIDELTDGDKLELALGEVDEDGDKLALGEID